MKRIKLKDALRLGPTCEKLIRGPTGFESNVVGAEPMPLERAHRILARCIEREKNPDYVSISWASQEEAAALGPTLETALAEIAKRDLKALESP